MTSTKPEAPATPTPVRDVRSVSVVVGSVCVVVGLFLGGVVLGQASSNDETSSQEAALDAPRPPTATVPPYPTATSAGPTPRVEKERATKGPDSPVSRDAAVSVGSARKAEPSSSGGSGTSAKKPTEEAKKKPKPADPSVNLAASKPAQGSSFTQDYRPGQVTDGNPGTYWEAEAGFPQTITVDLGKLQTVGRLVLSLPPVPDWNSRTQTIAVQGRGTGRWLALKAADEYAFDANAASDNQVSASFKPARVRYLQLTITANSGWPNAQLGELAVHSS